MSNDEHGWILPIIRAPYMPPPPPAQPWVSEYPDAETRRKAFEDLAERIKREREASERATAGESQ